MGQATQKQAPARPTGLVASVRKSDALRAEYARLLRDPSVVAAVAAGQASIIATAIRNLGNAGLHVDYAMAYGVAKRAGVAQAVAHRRPAASVRKAGTLVTVVLADGSSVQIDRATGKVVRLAK